MSFISAMDIINIEIKVRKVEQIMEKIQDMDLLHGELLRKNQILILWF